MLDWQIEIGRPNSPRGERSPRPCRQKCPCLEVLGKSTQARLAPDSGGDGIGWGCEGLGQNGWPSSTGIAKREDSSVVASGTKQHGNGNSNTRRKTSTRGNGIIPDP